MVKTFNATRVCSAKRVSAKEKIGKNVIKTMNALMEVALNMKLDIVANLKDPGLDSL